MLILPTELNAKCLALFEECDEFNSLNLLISMFDTPEFLPFKNKLIESITNSQYASEVKNFLLETELADGRALMLPFLNALRQRYPEQNVKHGELNRLYQHILVQHALNRHYICHLSGTGDRKALELHEALVQEHQRPWLDLVDALDITRPGDSTRSGDPAAVRQVALRGCASLLLILSPGDADPEAQQDWTAEWQHALRDQKPIIPLRYAHGVELPPELAGCTVLDFTDEFEPALNELCRLLDRMNISDAIAEAGQAGRESAVRDAHAEHDARIDNRDIRTGGGPYVQGDVNANRDFVGRDQNNIDIDIINNIPGIPAPVPSVKDGGSAPSFKSIFGKRSCTIYVSLALALVFVFGLINMGTRVQRMFPARVTPTVEATETLMVVDVVTPTPPFLVITSTPIPTKPSVTPTPTATVWPTAIVSPTSGVCGLPSQYFKKGVTVVIVPWDGLKVYAKFSYFPDGDMGTLPQGTKLIILANPPTCVTNPKTNNKVIMWNVMKADGAQFRNGTNDGWVVEADAQQKLIVPQ